MKDKSELTTNGMATYLSDDFRVYEPETCSSHVGTIRTYRLCEELVGGRWEGFVSIVSEEPDPTHFVGQDADGNTYCVK